MISSIGIRAIVHATEEVEKVKKAIQNIASGDAEVVETRMQGHFGNPIVIIHSSIKGKKRCEEFLKSLKEGLSQEDYQRLKKELPMRVDEDCNLYIRLDKQALFKGTINLARSDDAVAMKAKIKVYPAKQENALRVARSIFT